MAALKVSKPLAEGAPKAASKLEAATASARASVAETAQSLGDYLRDQRRGAQLTLRQLADQAGVSNPYLSQIERGLRRPSADVLQQIAKALRISAETLYVRAGILDPDEHGAQSVQSAVLGDADLSERQKQVLLEIYASFRQGNLADDAEQT
jgi:transcriptional regulator with XRE-family HTH domain